MYTWHVCVYLLPYSVWKNRWTLGLRSIYFFVFEQESSLFSWFLGQFNSLGSTTSVLEVRYCFALIGCLDHSTSTNILRVSSCESGGLWSLAWYTSHYYAVSILQLLTQFMIHNALAPGIRQWTTLRLPLSLPAVTACSFESRCIQSNLNYDPTDGTKSSTSSSAITCWLVIGVRIVRRSSHVVRC